MEGREINGALVKPNVATQQNASASEELATTAEEMGGKPPSFRSS